MYDIVELGNALAEVMKYIKIGCVAVIIIAVGLLVVLTKKAG